MVTKKTNQNHIVKRGGHSESYDERKLYASVYSSCIAVRESAPTAELIADKVCQDVGGWLSNKHEVTSADIRKMASVSLHDYNQDAAWIYRHHRNVS